MLIERTAACPQCGRMVHLTEPELVTKRGFCAVCDARFELVPDLFVGDGPMRSLTVPRLGEHQPAPSRMKEIGGRFVIRPKAAGFLSFATLAAGTAGINFITDIHGFIRALLVCLSIGAASCGIAAALIREECALEEGFL